MYERETVRNTKSLFYTSFGKFMKNEYSKSGLRVKWINYQTGIKQLYIRLDADNKNARFCIDIQHKDIDIRELQYAQFVELNKLFTAISDLNWTWNENFTNENSNQCCRISTEIENFNIYDKANWKIAFDFYKKSLIHFDEFWYDYKELFLQLQ
ncbi:DUF4268 domain-containing protein [Flavobacteriales bacterium]|nr:DUF4268 domain-containing protein [Flavobacteriales bacterium]